MFARGTSLYIQTGLVEKAVDTFKKSIDPVVRTQPGFRGYYLLLDRDGGKAMTISFWDERDDMVRSETTGYYLKQVAKIRHAFADRPVQEQYEHCFSCRAADDSEKPEVVRRSF